MDTPFESRVWQKALDRGLLSTRQVNECLKESDSTAPTLRLTEILVTKGYLKAEQVQEIRGQLAVAEPEAPEEVRRAARDPRKLIGRYVVVRELGRGGMGIVYKAWDGDLRRFVALKVLSGPWDDQDLARFRREAQSAAALNHPNIITVFEISPSDETPYIALELIDGCTLDGRTLPPRKAAELMVAIARAVEAAHRRGIIHRDLKPSNIMIDAKGCPRVMDFGLAKPVSSSSQITVSGTVMGTPAYMSPEQAQGRVREVDQRSDLFSLGAMLYEILTGQAPFGGKTPLETLTAVVECRPVRPTRLSPSIPRPLEAILLTCLHKDRMRRYPSCDALARDLERFLQGEKVLARLPLAPGRKAVFALSAAVALAAGLAAMFRPATPPHGPARTPPAAATPVDRSDLDRGLRLLEESRLDLYRAGIPSSAIVAKLHEAHGRFDAALRADPESGAAFLARGEVRVRLNRLEEALPDFAEAVRRLPTSPAVHLARGRLRLERYLRELGSSAWTKGELPEEIRRWRDEARADFTRARELSPAQDELPFLQVCLALADERPEEAVRVATRSIPGAGRPEELYKLRGDARAALASQDPSPAGRAALLQKSIEDFGQAVRLRYHYPDAYRLRGAALWHLGRADEALRDFRTVLEMDPGDSRALSDIGTFHIHADQIDLAREYLDRAIAADGRNYRALTNRASIHLQRKRLSDARADLERALQVSPDHLAARFNLCVVHHKLRQPAEALRGLDEILRRTPDFARARAQRAVIYYEAGRWKEALDDMERTVALDPSQESLFRSAIDRCRSELRRR